MLKRTMKKGETLLIENHDGDKIEIEFTSTTYNCAKVQITASRHYLIHQKDKKNETTTN